ncbi:MAG: hypothetical protein AAF478_04160 [Pseudomonadota bacterium]
MKVFIPHIFLVFLVFPSTAFAELDCDPLNGEWSGSMRGLLNGTTSMTIKNCRLKWKLPDGRLNRCKYRERGGEIRYSCSLGSKGVVKINGSKITMKNIYTAARHGAYTVKISKTSQ